MKLLCPRCRVDLCVGTSGFGFVKHYKRNCPNCGLRYVSTNDGTVWIVVGKYHTPDWWEAEQLAKEQGIKLPEWSKKDAPEDASAK